MIPLILIAFREFLEAWLVVGLFLGISKKFNLGREREIIAAVVCGMLVALAIPIAVFFLGSRVQALWSETTVDTVQGVVMIVAALSIAVVALSLHRLFKSDHLAKLRAAKERMQEREFDAAIFTAITLSIVREGLEVGLFALSAALVTPTHLLFSGLLAGFLAAGAVGSLVMVVYERLPIQKIFVWTEYAIMIVGAALLKNGVAKLFDAGFGIDLGHYLPLPLSFLPDAEENMLGHLLKNIFGVDASLSLVTLALLVAYAGTVYYFVFRKQQ